MILQFRINKKADEDLVCDNAVIDTIDAKERSK